MDKSHQMIYSDEIIKGSVRFKREKKNKNKYLNFIFKFFFCFCFKFLDDLKLNLFSENIYEAFSYLEEESTTSSDSTKDLAGFNEALSFLSKAKLGF